jgi:hypothetical protein
MSTSNAMSDFELDFDVLSDGAEPFWEDDSAYDHLGLGQGFEEPLQNASDSVLDSRLVQTKFAGCLNFSTFRLVR